ncbi:DUF3990 domain-containing protein [Butyrivibrio sp. MC2013]|uniref:DUF3990 domain-containing protein n=1 Tax=Butyrivibrio sp. MC2013 TaxID=1280686 RepID=UPI0003F51B8A|nr:DUF3990 domain-containing protein [Butyrivibrio sp. MC2013]
MIVYHGSIEEIRNPDVLHSFRPLDFGKGFYVTSVKEQAERWALRKADIYNRSVGIVNTYTILDQKDGLIEKRFDEDLAEWIDFVCRCRDGYDDYLKYDLIVGKVADDKVFRVVDMYHSGIWDRDRALREIKAYPSYDQSAFITQKAIDQLLIFESSYEVSNGR